MLRPSRLIRTALHYAAYHGGADMVQILLTNNADLTIKCNSGTTALGKAVYRAREGFEMDFEAGYWTVAQRFIEEDPDTVEAYMNRQYLDKK